MSPVEFDKLWRRYDPLNGGMVSKKVFINKITNKSESPDRRSVVSRSTNVSNNWTSSNNTYHIVIGGFKVRRTRVGEQKSKYSSEKDQT